jgi:hypothetical protein
MGYERHQVHIRVFDWVVYRNHPGVALRMGGYGRLSYQTSMGKNIRVVVIISGGGGGGSGGSGLEY